MTYIPERRESGAWDPKIHSAVATGHLLSAGHRARDWMSKDLPTWAAWTQARERNVRGAGKLGQSCHSGTVTEDDDQPQGVVPRISSRKFWTSVLSLRSRSGREERIEN